MNNPIDPVAYVFRHKRTGEVVVTSGCKADYWDKENWEHTATIEPITVLQLIVKSNGQKRAKIIRDLGKKP